MSGNEDGLLVLKPDFRCLEQVAVNQYAVDVMH